MPIVPQGPRRGRACRSWIAGSAAVPAAPVGLPDRGGRDGRAPSTVLARFLLTLSHRIRERGLARMDLILHVASAAAIVLAAIKLLGLQ